ncbi:hypothetical protein EG028_11665 [Chitinophaga barathri]|uniref:PorT family protein n=2 Tax=Chitinophaga barathri TaxID=1647451 RepID=A0A3N4MB40_9BACT|nr:hypothetical protein EG028_11665 [Chitinophaga barathri]
MLCITAQAASAQALIALVFGGKIKNDNIKLGIYLGGSGSWITDGDGQQPRIGLAFGAYTVFKLKPKLDLCMYIIMKSPKGAKQLNYTERLVQPADSGLVGADLNRNFTYINISPILRYNITPSFALGFGPQLAGRMHAKDNFTRDVNDGTLMYMHNVKDYIKLVDAGLTFDMQYTLMKGEGLRLNLQYNMGLFNIYNGESGLNGQNRQILVGVGIPIGRKKPDTAH